MAVLKKQLIMNIGKTQNNFVITEKMVKNSLSSFINKPIVKKINSNLKVIGYIKDNVCIKGNNVYADIFLIDFYKDKWKGKWEGYID